MVVWLCISKICKLKCFPIIGTWNEMISFSPGENRLESVVGIVCNLMLIMMSVGLDFHFFFERTAGGSQVCYDNAMNIGNSL